jgi:opacity protein-like surface antigen
MASLKALTLASVAVLALTRFATAADLLPPPPAIEPAPPVAAPEFGGWYLRGDIGAAFNYGSNLNLVNSPEPLPGCCGPGANESFNNTTVSASVLGDVGVGYQFNTWLRGDITGEYRDGGNFQSLYMLNNPNFAGTPNPNSQILDFYRANTASAVGLVNVYADLGTWYGLTPFVGGGVGVARNWLYGMTDQGVITNGATGASGPSGGYFSNGATTNFAWALMAGLDFNVTQNLKLELGYRYLNLGKITSGASNCANGTGAGNGFNVAYCGGSNNFVRSTGELASNDFRIGLRWMLGDNAVFAPPPEAPLVRKY